VLDQHEYRIAVERSRAALAQALARIGLDSNQLEVTPETTPAIRQATAQMEDARSRYESAAKLVKTGDIANERYIELENAYRTRQAALDAALDELRTQLAGVQAIRAELKLAEKRLADTIVRAPFDGGVSERNVAPGQYIAANTPIVTLVKSWPLRLRVDVPESAAASVRPGTSLVFSTDAAPGVEFRALVKQLNPSLDAKARSLTAEARLAQADARLKPGMFVQVRLITAADQQIVTVPREALFTVAGLTKVYVISAGQAKERRFTPGLERDGWVEVPGGTVKPGEHVAISNLQNLAEGVAVKPTPPRKG
jgi:RND family efflux transporter MFP subunit